MNKKNILKVAIFAVLSIVIISMGTCLAAIKEPDSVQWSYITSTSILLDKCEEYEDYDIFECAADTSSSYGTTAYVKVELKYYKDGKWQVYDSWEDSGNRLAAVDECIRVTPGYTYRVFTTHKVYSSSGALLETFTDKSSNTIASLSRN